MYLQTNNSPFFFNWRKCLRVVLRHWVNLIQRIAKESSSLHFVNVGSMHVYHNKVKGLEITLDQSWTNCYFSNFVLTLGSPLVCLVLYVKGLFPIFGRLFITICEHELLSSTYGSICEDVMAIMNMIYEPISLTLGHVGPTLGQYTASKGWLVNVGPTL